MIQTPTVQLRDKSTANSHPPSASPDPHEAAPPPTMYNVFVGRQPIYDRQLDVIAYQLLFRSSVVNQAECVVPYQASAQVILNTIVDIGLDALVGDKRAFIVVTRGFLLSDHMLMFPSDRIGIGVPQDMVVDDEVLEVLRALSAQGYTIALDRFIYHDSLRPLVELADIIKLDVSDLDRPRLEEYVALLRQYEVTLLAEKVETQEEFRYCIDLGFDYVQGFFLCEPEVIKGQRIPANRLALAQVLAELQQPEVNFGKLEVLISRDVTLSYRMLRIINSAYYGIQRKTDTIGQALIFLGTTAITSLVSLLLLANIDDKPHDLLTTALVRAKMCELLVQEQKRRTGSTFFLVGLLSVLDAFLDRPMPDILASLPLSEAITQALLAHEGELGVTLRCVMAYERADWAEVDACGFEREVLVDAYLKAIAWADQMHSTL